MGSMKNLLIKYDELRAVAKEILKDLKIIKCCICCEYYVSCDELTPDIYAKATNIAKEKYNIKLNDIKDFHSILKDVYSEAGVDSIEEHFDLNH